MTSRTSATRPLSGTATLACAALVLSACGGGGGDAGPVAPAAGTTLSGVAAKGPLKAALVTAYPVSAAGAVGSTEIAHRTTDASGAYTLDLGGYAGAVQLVVTAPAGATTADEASGRDVVLPATFSLHANAVVAASTGNQTQSASVTAYTELAHHIATDAGGATPANIANANGVVFALIGFDPVATQPLAANATPPAGATEVQKRYALLNAAVSKLAASTPQTADATSVACYAAAAGDLGKKIQCATQQIGSAVTVSGSGAQQVTAVNNRLVGLADALVAVSSDASVNKTGSAITTSDSAFETLHAVETAAASGSGTPINGGASGQTRSDVAVAKQFFSALRSNAATLHSGTVDTGLVDGVRAFAASMRSEVTPLTGNFMRMAELPGMALNLWTAYKAGGTTNPSKSLSPSTAGGCTVYQGSFPAQIGPAIGQPYVVSSVVATSAANASWVGCSSNSGPLPSNGTRRYRQVFVFNTAADATLAAVPYLAVTRAEYVQAGTTYEANMSANVSGTVGFPTGGGNVPGALLAGDLPPGVAADGSLLAARYPVNLAYTLTQAADGVQTAALSQAHLGVVATGATQEGLVIDLSPGGASRLVGLPHGDDVAQAAAAKINLVAKVSDAKGTMNGSLVIDQLVADGSGNVLSGHARFSGDIAVAPLPGGVAGTPVTFFSGTLDESLAANRLVSFSGNLTLPNRPVATLTLSATETPANSATLSLEGRYVQNGVTVTITGAQTPTGSSATFADSTGVSTTVSSSSNTANVTVGGRQTAVIDKRANRITYSDGTFESLT